MAHLFQTNLDDVWSGRVAVRHVLMLLERSPSYTDSLMREQELGPDLARWDKTTDVVAHMADLMAALMTSLSGSGNSMDSLRYPRPKSPGYEATDPNLFAPTIADFDVDGFMRVINNK